MHATSYEAMRTLVEKYLDRSAELSILDVGSFNVNGTYRPLFDSASWTYTGTDIQPGRNVDVVMPSPYQLPFDSGSCDVVISGQCIEHVEFPWESVREMARVLKPGGLILLIAPSQGHEHRYPIDCYRYLPDGYRALAKWAGLEVVEAFRAEKGYWRDMVGVFRRPTGGANDDSRTADNREGVA